MSEISKNRYHDKDEVVQNYLCFNLRQLSELELKKKTKNDLKYRKKFFHLQLQK